MTSTPHKGYRVIGCFEHSCQRIRVQIHLKFLVKFHLRGYIDVVANEDAGNFPGGQTFPNGFFANAPWNSIPSMSHNLSFPKQSSMHSYWRLPQLAGEFMIALKHEVITL